MKTHLVIGIALAIGWILNIIQLFSAWGSSVTVGVIMKLIGVVFPPLGGILGYVGLF